MKKISVVLAVLLMLAGCSANSDVFNYDIDKSTTPLANVSTTPTVIDGYELAEYDKYNSYARDNGLDGDKIYIDGTVTDVVFLEDAYFCVIVETDGGNKWCISSGAFPIHSAAGLEELDEKEARVFFEYQGFSDVFKMPTGTLLTGGKIECQDGSIYIPTLATKDELCAWIDENGVPIIYADYDSDLVSGQYFIATGIIDNLSTTIGYSFDFCEKAEDGYTRRYEYISKDEAIYGVDEIATGDGIKIYGLVGEDKTTTILAVSKAEINYSLDDVMADFKSKCEKYDYKTIARDPDVYKGKMARFTGEVIQVMESGSSVTLRVNVTKGRYGYDDTVYVAYTRKSDTESRILEDDIITMYGTLAGLQTYETILGGNVTIPKFNAEYIEIKP